MKILVIADLHWLNVWKKFIQKDDFDRVIFLWDYVDSFIAPDSDIVKNLREIIEYKKENPDKVILLLGNHDVQYFNEWCGCSWYRGSIASVLRIIFEENIKLFKILHYEEWYLFSHAWITESWLKENEDIIEEYFPWLFYKYEDLNYIFWTHNKDMFFQCWRSRWWYDNFSWPLWADRDDTTKDWVLNWLIQVVWHTKVPYVIKLPHIIYCDCLEYWNWQPLIINTEDEKIPEENS